MSEVYTKEMFREDMKEDMVSYMNHENLMRSDWDAVVKEAGLYKEMSVSAFAKSLALIRSYDWTVSNDELMEEWEATR